MTKLFFVFLCALFLRAVVVADDVVLPGDNVLGQVHTDCDEGKANNDPRTGGKIDVLGSDADDNKDGSKIREI